MRCSFAHRFNSKQIHSRQELSSTPPKVLILPLAFALGPEEAAVIRDFVREGGTVLADVRPGAYDGHCKPLDAGILDDVFGIERTGKQEAVELDRMEVAGDIAGTPVSMRWGNWRGKEIYPQMKVDPAVTLTTGKELGKAFPIHFWWGLNHPVCIVNEFGKGRAVLLNFPIYNAPLQSLVQSVLASAGVTPRIAVVAAEGEPAPGLEITRWQNEGIELLALFGKYDGEVLVRLPESRFVYDIKAHTALGETEAFATHVRPNRASFFALLPKEAPRPRLSLCVDATQAGALVVSCVLDVPKAQGLHAVRVTGTTPDGTPAAWFRRDLLVGHEPETFDLSVAHNDPSGVWSVHATDLYTNGTVTERIALAGP